jgi:hypothetical protein
LEKIKIQLEKNERFDDQSVEIQDVNMTAAVLENEDGEDILT